jgi:hypothetical protein
MDEQLFQRLRDAVATQVTTKATEENVEADANNDNNDGE